MGEGKVGLRGQGDTPDPPSGLLALVKRACHSYADIVDEHKGHERIQGQKSG